MVMKIREKHVTSVVQDRSRHILVPCKERYQSTKMAFPRRGNLLIMPLLVEVFKNGFGKTMSSAVLENDFKKTAKSMPTDRNALGDAYYAAQCMSASIGSW